MTVRIAVCLAAVVVLGSCARVSQSWYLSGCDRDINNSTRAIESAHSNTERATAYAQRGRAYSEKARYSRFFKLIPADEYGRLFTLAVGDHEKSLQADTAGADIYFSRGRTYYDRASLEETKDAKPWFDLAAADFKRAFEKDARNYMAVDMLGLAHQQAGELDEAIRDFTAEMSLNRLGRSRLADAYCVRGSSNLQAKNYDSAIADFEKAIEIGATDDGCSCEPYHPLMAIYLDVKHQSDRAWEVVRKAQLSRRWIDPDLLKRLKQANPQ